MIKAETDFKIDPIILVFVVLLDVFAILSGCGTAFQPPNRYFTADLSSEHASEFPFQTGIASWYGPKFHGRTTANGEIFDMNRLTAAHPTLPFGTIVRVINQKNNKGVVVRINDRGPFLKGRIVDLSFQAAKSCGMVIDGIVPVILEIVSYPNQIKPELETRK